MSDPGLDGAPAGHDGPRSGSAARRAGGFYVYDVGVRVIVDHPVDRPVIEDPLPAGFEAVDTTFRTSLKDAGTAERQLERHPENLSRSGRSVCFAPRPGIYDVHYRTSVRRERLPGPARICTYRTVRPEHRRHAARLALGGGRMMRCVLAAPPPDPTRRCMRSKPGSSWYVRSVRTRACTLRRSSTTRRAARARQASARRAELTARSGRRGAEASRTTAG